MPAPIDRATLDRIIAAMDPHAAGELIDVLACLGLLPPTDTDPTEPIGYIVNDRPLLQLVAA